MSLSEILKNRTGGHAVRRISYVLPPAHGESGRGGDNALPDDGTQLAERAERLARREETLRAMERRALTMIEEARTTARAMLQEAEGEVQNRHEAGYEAGRLAGQQQGRQEALQEQEDLTAQAREVLRKAEEERGRRVRSSESLMTELVVGATERLLSRKLQDDGKYVARLVEELLAEMDRARRVEVRVSMNDFAAALAERETFAKNLPQQVDLAVVPDRSLAVGDVVIHTDLGSIDGRVETRIEQLRQALAAIAKEWEQGGQQ